MAARQLLVGCWRHLRVWCTGLRFADVNGDNLVDWVKAGRTYPQLSTAIKTGLHDGKVPDLLTHVTTAQGGTADVTYKCVNVLLDGTGVRSNTKIPFAVDTVAAIAQGDELGNYATTTYTYGGGQYYYANALDRKFSGFATTTQTDAVGNLTKTYYHQGNGSQSALGEYNDHISKAGKPYRIEKYDSQGHLYDLVVNQWDRYALNATSSFVKVTRTTDLTYDGDATQRDKAEEYTYDNTTGNLTNKTEWGEVTAATDGSFTDIGSDKRTDDITYSASSIGWLFAPKQETVKNQSGTVLNDTRYYYDTQALGTVLKGNPTKTEKWVAGSKWVNTQKAFNTYGLVTQDTDERGKNTTYSYDAYNLYAATTTNPVGLITARDFDYSSGKVTKTVDPNTRVFTTTYDGLDRPLQEQQPDLTTPSTLVTKATYAYTDTGVPTSVHKTDYLDGSNTVDSYQYLDGLGRPIQTRKEAETAGQYVVSDTVYDARELVAKASLPYFGSGTTVHGDNP